VTVVFDTPAHIGYAVSDLAAAMLYFSELLATEWEAPRWGHERDFLDESHEIRRWHLDYVFSEPASGVDGLRIELLAGASGTTWFTTRPAAVHHVAHYVDDVGMACEYMIKRGWTLELRHADPRPMSFAYLTAPSQTRLELLLRP
jgi:catechol 2,3-dioxygenase-like lactoylglutathione lyase family enzyme